MANSIDQLLEMRKEPILFDPAYIEFKVGGQIRDNITQCLETVYSIEIVVNHLMILRSFYDTQKFDYILFDILDNHIHMEGIFFREFKYEFQKIIRDKKINDLFDGEI